MKYTILFSLLLALSSFQISMEKINLHLKDASQELKDSKIIYGTILTDKESTYIQALTDTGIIWKYSNHRRIEKDNLVTFEKAELAWRKEFRLKEDCLPIIKDKLASFNDKQQTISFPTNDCLQFFWTNKEDWEVRFNCDKHSTPDYHTLYNEVEALISENLIFQGVPTTQE